MELLQRLRMRYPALRFERDHVSGVISFTHDDMCIVDPFVSECGRFRMAPSYYGITEMDDAVEMAAHNMPLLEAERLQQESEDIPQ